MSLSPRSVEEVNNLRQPKSTATFKFKWASNDFEFSHLQKHDCSFSSGTYWLVELETQQPWGSPQSVTKAPSSPSDTHTRLLNIHKIRHLFTDLLVHWCSPPPPSHHHHHPRLIASLSITTGGSLKHEWGVVSLSCSLVHFYFFFPFPPLSFFPSFFLSHLFAPLMNIKCGVPAMRLAAATAEGLNH